MDKPANEFAGVGQRFEIVPPRVVVHSAFIRAEAPALQKKMSQQKADILVIPVFDRSDIFFAMPLGRETKANESPRSLLPGQR
jgi:hypothetical protein